jgi:hypothetical protein
MLHYNIWGRSRRNSINSRKRVENAKRLQVEYVNIIARSLRQSTIQSHRSKKHYKLTMQALLMKTCTVFRICVLKGFMFADKFVRNKEDCKDF